MAKDDATAADRDPRPHDRRRDRAAGTHPCLLDVDRDPRPHDLLWVGDTSALTCFAEWPAWATPQWLAVAPVVVRRAPMHSTDGVPVGLRGRTRSERCAAHVAAAQVIRRVTPEDIARRVSTGPPHADASAAPPCMRTLQRLAPALDDLGLTWGVTGSVGFTLASGIDVLRAGSDLDLRVLAPARGDDTIWRALAALVHAAECPVDIQVETAHGAFALAEWSRTGGPVLLKTAHGPALCDDPWQPAAVRGAEPAADARGHPPAPA